MNQYTNFWMEKHVDALAVLVAKGVSRRDSAAILNAQFGTTYTRNAVIGVAHRRRLMSPLKIKLAPKKRHQAYKPRPKREPKHMSTAEYVAIECLEIVPRGLTLLDLEPYDCRYPINDTSPFLFCGHQQVEGSKYCLSHTALSRKGHS